MTPEELLSEYSVKIYSLPLSEHRDSGQIADVSNPVSVLMLLIDFDTELMMNGFVDGFLGNSTGRYANETVSALRAIGCEDLASSVAHLIDTAGAAGMTYEAIQEDRSGLPLYSVTSFNQRHGDRWRETFRRVSSAAHDLDLQPMYAGLERYAAHHHDVLLAALTSRPTAAH